MSRESRRSYDSDQLPKGALAMGILLLLLAAGVWLIVSGLMR